MITNATSGATSSTAGAASMKESTGLNKDDFLKLFVTQLQNQDPLNPQDSSAFVSQLAQLSQVEQAYNTNTNLTNLLSQGNNTTALGSVAMIGKVIEAKGSEISHEAGTPAAINFALAQAADQVTVTVKDENGTVVKTISAGAKNAGAVTLTWDGTNNSGAQVPSGAYSFSVSAKDASGNSVSSNSIIRGTVDGIDMSGTTPVLFLGRIKVNLTDVTGVMGV